MDTAGPRPTWCHLRSSGDPRPVERRDGGIRALPQLKRLRIDDSVMVNGSGRLAIWGN
jgi:hypothetical protein